MDRRGPPASLRPQGQAGHLPLHGRRAVAPGNVRLQADAGEDERPADARVVHQGQPIAQLQGQKLNCFAPAAPVHSCGQSGQEISAIFPHLATVADELCIIRSMVTEAINHDPAHTFMNTGTTISGRPAMGSWVNYGLGSDSDRPARLRRADLDGPLRPGPADRRAAVAQRLPAQPVPGRRVLLPGRPGPVRRQAQRRDRRPPARRGRCRRSSSTSSENALVDDPEIATRITAYETAFRMQTSVPELMDLSGEPKHILDLYGTQGGDGSFAANCLLARRLAERGVRFIQLYHRDWDHHGAIKEHIAGTAREVDQGAAALIKDLKQRGMLDDTLVVWGGEFGRTPMAQGDGRDHHIKGFSIWMAGGGIKGGITHGATDELGYDAVQDVVHVHDLHATILHLFGIDHLRLTYRFQGRDFRLTDVAGKVVKAILA